MNASRITQRLDALKKSLWQTYAREICMGAACAIAADAAAMLALAQFNWVRTAIYGGALVLCGIGLALAWQLHRLHRKIAGPNAIWPARMAQQLAPQLGTALTSAVDFAEQLGGNRGLHFSAQLAETHIASTAAALENIDFPAQLRLGRAKLHRQLSIACVVSLASVLLLVPLLTNARARLRGFITDPQGTRLSDIPLAGDIHLSYHYPEYTHLPGREVQGGDGSIQAVVGTEVELTCTSDMPVQSGVLRVETPQGTEPQDVPMVVQNNRRLSARLAIVRDARYRFVFTELSGDRIADKHHHPIRASLDAYPEVFLDEPAHDVELRENQTVDLRWRAQDDFGISDVQLVVDLQDQNSPTLIPLPADDTGRHGGVYRWSLASLRLEPGKEAQFHITVSDNDAINGPKKSNSSSRRLVLFSAKQHHEDLLQKQHAVLDAWVDWLAAELLAPLRATGEPADTAAALAAQADLIERMQTDMVQLADLLAAMKDDKFIKPELHDAFGNLLEHVTHAHDARQQALAQTTQKRADLQWLARAQTEAIAKLEKDIIYLDDLLAINKLDELKSTAKELLSAQHALQDMLAQYKQTQSPALKAQLQERIADLRQRMMELLAKMSAIKKGLPGEYRNMESAQMLRLDDDLNRLQKTLQEGDIDKAAQELEQLANMVENMVDRISHAQDEYGGERYDGMREQLKEFADAFKNLESEQKQVSQLSQELLQTYRKKSLAQVGNDLDKFVKTARAQVALGLQALDGIGQNRDSVALGDHYAEGARQSLLDLDALLAHRDFAEALGTAQNAVANADALSDRLGGFAERAAKSGGDAPKHAAQEAAQASQSSHEVLSMLEKLFPDAKKVLGPEQAAQMQRLGKKQQSLEQQARELEGRMEQLSGELPVFGGTPKASLDGARGEMSQAARDISGGQLPDGAGHGRRAAEQLGKLRENLERASSQSGKGIPMPLGEGSSPGGNGPGGYSEQHQEVDIPKFDRSQRSPKFRQDLLEAAKQKSPAHFEEAVRRYYEELIR